MKNNIFYFIVRDYSCSLTDELISIILNECEDAEFHILTMHTYVLDYFKRNNSKKVTIHFIPKLLELANESTENCYNLESFLFKTYGFGLNRIYDIERFKPTSNHDLFIIRHVNVLFEVIKNPGVLISLTMDHFVYVLSGLINEYTGGQNIFIQPVGFPLNSYILMKNPWVRIQVFNKEKNSSLLKEYKDSLVLHPKESVWYMKEEQIHSSLLSRAKNKLNRLLEIKKVMNLKKNFTAYSYLDYLYIIDKGLHLPEYTGAHLPNNQIKIEELKQKYYGKHMIFFYPLHLEPEMTILAYSPFFQNQLELIKLTSKSLKFGDVLILKENPKSFYRGSSFYKEIESLANVKWVSNNENSRDIIRISSKVIGLSGTASIEAACMGIKSLGAGFPPFHEMLVQSPITNYPLVNFANELYKDFSSEEISEKLYQFWPSYSQSIVQINLKVSHINSILVSGQIISPKEKAQEVYFKIIRPCVEFWD